MQQQTTAFDLKIIMLLSAAQNGTNPLALQHLLAALGQKDQQTQPQQTQFPFQLPMVPNPLAQFGQQPNGWMNQQVNNPANLEKSTLSLSYLVPKCFSTATATTSCSSLSTASNFICQS